MNGVIVSVEIEDLERATKYLKEQIVPNVSQAPGFVAGWWVTVDDGKQGRGTMIFDSEEAARAVADGIEEQPGESVTIKAVEVGEVAAKA